MNDQIKYSLTSLEIRKLTIMRPFSEICYDNEMSQGSLSFLFAFIPTLFQLQPQKSLNVAKCTTAFWWWQTTNHTDKLQQILLSFVEI